MKKAALYYVLWGVLYSLCLGLGFITERSTAGQWILTLLSIAFFIPGGLLLYTGIRANDKKLLLQVRWISAIALSATLLLLVLNILSVFGSQTLGDVLHVVLCIVSVPMLCSGYWVLSLFLWACLLLLTFPKIWRK